MARHRQAVTAVLVTAVAWSLPAPVMGAEGTLAIRAGLIETVAGEPIENGIIVINDGRIEAVGTEIEVPQGAELIDATEGVVFPGMVNAWSGLGVSRSSSTKPASNPHYRVADELYPHQDIYKRAVMAGFTTLCLRQDQPGVAGQAALVRTVAGDADEMLITDRGGPIVINFPGPDADLKSTIKGALERAKGGQGGEESAALSLAVQGKIPTLVACSGAGSVAHMQELLEPYKEMKTVLVLSGSEIHRLAEQLGAKKAAVITPPIITYERYTRNRISVPRILEEAGVKLACNPAGNSAEAYDAFRMAMAEQVRAGLPREAAQKAMTLHPAEMLDLDYRLGSIEPGKDANLVILTGDPLDPKATVQRVLIEGQTVYDAAWGGLR